jgi:circadian clock protein KaiC
MATRKSSGSDVGIKDRPAREAGRTRIGIEKCPTGINGLDEIMEGGLPRGRPTLVCGGAGSGKTLLAAEFIARGIREFDEPGAFMTFEETTEELLANVESLGFNLGELQRKGKFASDYVYIDRSQIEETGQYDLEGLFVRLGSLIEDIGARRIALDTIEALFAGLSDTGIIRAELRRMFRWLKDRKVTAIITAEQGDGRLTRHGMEEYVSDCVILLDHRVDNRIATRHLRVIKYRGSKHGTNEYPTLIDSGGLSVLPLSTLGLSYPVSKERIPTGIDRLDTMLGAKGYYRGSSVLISGSAGTGKTSVATAFANSVCTRGEKCLYVSFEESPDQIMRNMRSIGFDLGKWAAKDLLRFCSLRPTVWGLEMHLVNIHNIVREFRPAAVIMDPITPMGDIGSNNDIRSMLTRVMDFLKNERITGLFTSLTPGNGSLEQSQAGISSLMDTWVLLKHVESQGERNRILYVLKSRGMAHSNQMREFLLSDQGIRLVDVYTGPGTLLTGSARIAQEARDRTEAEAAQKSFEKRLRDLSAEEGSMQAQIQSLETRLDELRNEKSMAEKNNISRLNGATREKVAQALSRKSDDQEGGS